MARINLSGGSYLARSASVSAQRCLNLYPEPVQPGTEEPAEFAYYPTPGLILSFQSSGKGRAAYHTSQGHLIIVTGSTVFWLREDEVRVSIGSIADGNGPVRIADNGTTLFLVDGTDKGGWYCSLPSNPNGHYGGLTQIQDEAFYGSATIALLDTFFLFTNPETTNWYVSPSQFADEKTTPFDPLYVASDTTSLGTLVAVAVVGQYIWLFSKNQIEFWYDSGASDFPFQRVQGVTVEAGCIAPYSIANVPTCAATPNGAIMWLGIDRAGMPRVYLGQQTTAVVVSGFAVDGAIQAASDLKEAVGNIYQLNGHIFYVLTIPSLTSSWVYDVSTGLWHERCSLDAEGNETQIRPLFLAQAYGKIWAVDRDNGCVYRVTSEAPDDAGTPIKRQRAFPHLLTNGNRAIHRRFMLDMQQAGGATVTLDWSDDRGATFKTGQALMLGTTGDMWPSVWRLGMARDRVYRVTWKAPIQTALMGAFLDIDPVRS